MLISECFTEKIFLTVKHFLFLCRKQKAKTYGNTKRICNGIWQRFFSHNCMLCYVLHTNKTIE